MLRTYKLCGYVENYIRDYIVLRYDSMMGKLNIKIKDKIDSKFRKEVFKRKGMKKGNLTQAVEEAMLMWISSEAVKNEEKA